MPTPPSPPCASRCCWWGGKLPLPEEGNKRQHLCTSLFLLTLQGLCPVSLALPPWALGMLCGEEEGRLNQEDGLGQSLEKGRPRTGGFGSHGLAIFELWAFWSLVSSAGMMGASAPPPELAGGPMHPR